MSRSSWTHAVLHILGRLVPPGERGEWLREWDAELDHLADVDPAGASRGMLGRLAAATEDALRLGLGRTRHGLPTGLARDVRFAARALARSPLFTAAVVVTLALGIGANAALFTVLNAALLEPLPYPESGRLVQLVWERDGRTRSGISTPDFDDLYEGSRTLEHLSLRIDAGAGLTYQADRPIVLPAASVSADYFRLFGTAPYLGRYFLPEDDVRGVTPSVVLSHGAWQRVFGGDPGIVGKTVMLENNVSGNPYVVVGVAEPGLRDPLSDVDLWTSRPAWIEAEKRGQGWLQVFGRIAPGATSGHADAELRALSDDLARQHPVSNADRTFAVASLQDRLADPIRPALMMLLAAVGLLLLITCANVANLILVRSAGRTRELAVRMSLGAGRGRLAGQLLIEGLLLAVLGGAAGLALALGATRGLVALGAPGVPRLAELQVDRTVLLFTLMVSSLTGLVFGLVPLLQVSGADATRSLREGGRSGEGRRARTVRRALVAAELAISTMLLVGGALLVRSLTRITQVDTGVRAERVLTFRISPPEEAFPTPADLRGFHNDVRTRISRLPGVEAVGAVSILPFTYQTSYGFVREDTPPPAPGERPSAALRVVEPGYFRSAGIPLVSGRLLDERDATDAPLALLVDQAMAREHFPRENALGKRITVHWGASVSPVSYQIVGVVGDVRHQGPTSAPEPTLYVPRGQDATPAWLNRAVWITVRTSGDPLALAEPARQAVWEVEPTVPVTEMGVLDDYLREHHAGTRNQALLIGFFALLATVLASVGIGGVVAYAVTRRGHEIGVRQALGADAGDVVRLVLGEGVRLMVLGVPLGLLLAAAASRMLRALLFGVEPGDPLTYVAVGLGLAAVALAAAWIPARRAAGVHPATALRSDR